MDGGWPIGTSRGNLIQYDGARDPSKELKRVNAARLKDWMVERGGF